VAVTARVKLQEYPGVEQHVVVLCWPRGSEGEWVDGSAFSPVTGEALQLSQWTGTGPVRVLMDLWDLIIRQHCSTNTSDCDCDEGTEPRAGGTDHERHLRHSPVPSPTEELVKDQRERTRPGFQFVFVYFIIKVFNVRRFPPPSSRTVLQWPCSTKAVITVYL